MITAHQIYGAAADFYENGGKWGQGDPALRPDTYCLSETLSSISKGVRFDAPHELVKLMVQETGCGIVFFNDSTETTVEMVIEVCKSIAAKGE